MAIFESLIVSPQSVWICWGENPSYWKVSPTPKSRFSQKAELLEVCWLQIQATVDTGVLDKDTTYSLLYFFKHKEQVKGLHSEAEVSLSQKDGKTICSRKVRLNPGSADLIRWEDEQWLALEMGRFKPSEVSREISANLLDTSGQWKSGLVFGGVEIRAVSN
ncbi:unnamed protein product [Victoria cruziana]